MSETAPETPDVVVPLLLGMDAKLTGIRADYAALAQKQAVTEARIAAHESREAEQTSDLKDAIGEIKERLSGIEGRLSEIERKGAVSLGRASVVGAVVGSVLTAVAEYVGTHGIPGLTH